MSIRLILVRHGETDWSLQKKYCGLSDIELNATGRCQAEMLGKRLSGEEIRKAYSSDLKRASESAKIALNGMSIEELPELREMNFGHFEGLRYAEVMERFGEVYSKWLSDPLSIRVPGGESLQEVAARVRQVLKRIISIEESGTIAMFTHAGPARVIMCDALGLELQKVWSAMPHLASVSEIEFHNGGAKVNLQNDIGHLNG